VFRRFDADGSGTIEREELREVFRHVDGNDWSEKQLDQLFDELDSDRDGNVSYREFLIWLAMLTGPPVRCLAPDLLSLCPSSQVDGSFELDGRWSISYPLEDPRSRAETRFVVIKGSQVRLSPEVQGAMFWLAPHRFALIAEGRETHLDLGDDGMLYFQDGMVWSLA
jgi:hypothetical protein